MIVLAVSRYADAFSGYTSMFVLALATAARKGS